MQPVAKIVVGTIALIALAVTTALGDDLTVTSFSSYAGQTNIVLQATGNVIFNGALAQLPALPPGAAGGLLLVQAGNDIVISSGTSISAGPGWSVSFLAGANFSAPGTVNPGVGNVTLQGPAALATIDGSISFLAGNGVTVGAGFINTTGGGGINVTAVAGTVNTGTRPNGFIFRNNPATPYLVDPNPGGISTAAGGDVIITAGQDIISLLPIGSATGGGGGGAFGPAPGNVTLTAGRNVAGHYVLRNGAGTINAGQDAGTASGPLALSLVAGGWNVTAAGNIVLQEIRNPNGIFNNIGSASSASYHYFDYSPGAYASLNAGDSVQLSGQALPRPSASMIGPLYPPSLNINAGAGGVRIGGDIVMFPSANGQLNVVTTNGGPLTSLSGNLVRLVMSDSAAVNYTSVTSLGPDDHAPVPVHLTDAVPARLNIAGDLDSVTLISPKHAEITVGGNMNGTGFSAQNLNSSDATFLSVAGDILNPPQASAAGYVVNGPGALAINARNLYLGGSAGIQSVGSLNNHALALLSPSGAEINVSLSGDLAMISNSIASVAGGDIRVYALGGIDAGSTNSPGVNNSAHGIFTTARANVSVVAGGNINLNGSRIAAYDGGNVYVASISGNVDASMPGDDSMVVTKVFGNPVQVLSYELPGEGILALTLPDSAESVGNITVLAAHDILLGCGAVTQASLNGTSGNAAVLTLQAGGDIMTTGNCAAVAGTGTVNISSGGPSIFLAVRVNATNLTAAVGTGVQFAVTAGGIAPFGFQWLKDGAILAGATNASLSLSNVQRPDAGNYTIVVTNLAGTVINDIRLRVLVPQLLGAALDPAGRTMLVSFAAADGGSLTARDIAGLTLQTSANLVDWAPVNSVISTNAGGGLSFQLQIPSDPGRGFYRILSQ